ncbi:signal peptidase I [Streptosporangium sp. NPDC051023]|uniref:signal peptidase I n=1 Tax=Streptosporangium sp. NPDC051023 TaxID=3155410 RepID=UPI003450D5D1
MTVEPENRPATSEGEPAPPHTAESPDNVESGAGEGAKGGKKKRSGRKSLVESLFLLMVGVAVALLLNLFVFGSFSIPSESMENTLLVGDRVFVNKLHGGTERGDVVVFKGWQGDDTIKRVIAVGGDTVKCCDAKGRITVNGVPLEEKDYLYPDDFPSGDKFEKVVPKGRLWVMGDHRSASADSRTHEEQAGEGTISEKAVIGRAFAIYWPFSRARLLSTPETFTKLR